MSFGNVIWPLLLPVMHKRIVRNGLNQNKGGVQQLYRKLVPCLDPYIKLFLINFDTSNFTWIPVRIASAYLEVGARYTMRKIALAKWKRTSWTASPTLTPSLGGAKGL